MTAINPSNVIWSLPGSDLSFPKTDSIVVSQTVPLSEAQRTTIIAVCQNLQLSAAQVNIILNERIVVQIQMQGKSFIDTIKIQAGVLEVAIYINNLPVINLMQVRGYQTSYESSNSNYSTYEKAWDYVINVQDFSLSTLDAIIGRVDRGQIRQKLVMQFVILNMDSKLTRIFHLATPREYYSTINSVLADKQIPKDLWPLIGNFYGFAGASEEVASWTVITQHQSSCMPLSQAYDNGNIPMIRLLLEASANASCSAVGHTFHTHHGLRLDDDSSPVSNLTHLAVIDELDAPNDVSKSFLDLIPSEESARARAFISEGRKLMSRYPIIRDVQTFTLFTDFIEKSIRYTSSKQYSLVGYESSFIHLDDYYAAYTIFKIVLGYGIPEIALKSPVYIKFMQSLILTALETNRRIGDFIEYINREPNGLDLISYRQIFDVVASMKNKNLMVEKLIELYNNLNVINDNRIFNADIFDVIINKLIGVRSLIDENCYKKNIVVFMKNTMSLRDFSKIKPETVSKLINFVTQNEVQKAKVTPQLMNDLLNADKDKQERAKADVISKLSDFLNDMS